MKKYLLLILTMLSVSIGTWADDLTSGTIGSSSSWSYADGNMTITLNATEDITSDTWSYGGNHPWQTYSYNNDITKVTFILGSSVSSVNDNILYLFSQKMTTVKTFDFSSLTDTQVGYFTAGSDNFKSDVTNVVKNVILPSGVTIDAVANNFTISGDVITATKLTDTSNIGWSALDGSTLKLTGTISSALNLSGSTSGITVIDLSEATVSANISLNEDYVTTVKVASDDVKQYIKKKDGSTAFDDSKIEVPFNPAQTVTGGSIQTQIEAYLANYTSKSAADITSLTVTGTLSAADVIYLSSLTGLTTLDLSGATLGEGVTKATVNAAVPYGTTVIFPSAYSISGTTVTVDMANALGDDLSTILINAKTDLGGSSIGTLIVTGTITNSDLAALADASMTGATRIDLSGATLASGASIDNLRVPSSLTQLVLPEDQTVSSTLATRLAAVTGLGYAYSPSSDAQRLGASSTSSYDGTKNKIADYVWVVHAGGLAQAFTNEEWLRNSFYIKVASSVALNATDVNFNALGTNKPTNYLFLDFSGSNLTPEMAANYRVTDNIGYRIILPDNWTNAQMAVFAGMDTSERGSLAAVYSYEGSKLNILVIDNSSYNGTALRNPRIVRSGTDAIEILQGTYSAGSHPFKPYSTDNDSDGVADGIINAINNAQESIKSVIINIGATANSVGDTYTFTNPNMTYLSLEGVKSGYGTNQGATLVISGANALKTLNLKNGAFAAVTATGLTSLETVDMTGTTFNGAADFSSNSNLTTLTTASDTDFKSSLNLTSSALTSFATPAKVTGDIYLNASTSLTSVDLTQTDFKSTTSKIHVDASATENAGNTAAIAGLDRAVEETAVKTIMVPNGFNSEERIHPYAAISDNIGETAAAGGLSDGDGCSISYDAATKIATVHATKAGHFANIMASNYSSFPIGTTFKFDSESVINDNDLKALAGYIKKTDNTEADYSWRSNYYYVDLFDLTASADLCNTPSTEYPNAKGAIYNTIEWLRTNNRQFKGLILPKDHTLYGSGTTLIQDTERTASAVATCSEFIAYYKTKEIKKGASEPSDLTNKLLVAHVYNQSNSSSAYQDSYDKMMSLLDLHTEIETDADIYSISTNSINKIDISDLPQAATEIEIVNNEMVGTATTANVYVYPDEAGHFATAVNATGLKSTPTELMKIEGPINSDDITAINDFDTDKTADKVNGPRVLDLSAATGVTKALVASLTNKDIEYIILPAGMTKDEVCNNSYSALTNLKAVISTDGTDLVAYVNTPGSLAEARYYATGGSITGNIFTPTQTGLQSVTLAGSLNASDIAANTTAHYVDASGHWASTGGNQSSLGLGSEQGTITTIDLKDAVFPTQEDMNFSYAGLGSIRNITLPTSEYMTLIPADCFEGITSFDDLCIPYNYTHIDNSALYGTYCSHITTTDANGALVDNGPKTYTFSKNLEKIGSKPDDYDDANGVYRLTETVFPQNRGVTDVYVLAHQVPKCYANAFPANMLYGWGGFRGGDFPYCREKYDNSSDGSLIFTVLHFPDEASWYASTDDKETTYAELKKKYTDVNKIYTKKEQTGAVDANGETIAWPTFTELGRAYNQATIGMTWNDWTTVYDGLKEVNGGTVGDTSEDEGGHAGDYNFEDYEGWHQFVLSLATYVESEEQNAVEREYVQGGYYTFCIPFDMTEEQVYEMLGVPYSTNRYTNKVGSNVIKKAGDASGYERLLPEIYTLKEVTRKPGTKNTIALRLTDDLAADGTYLQINNEGAEPEYTETPCGNNSAGEKIVIKGGYPYYIRPYLLKNETVKNLGKYVLTRYADKFKQAASCANHDETMEYLGASGTHLATLKFAKPYEEHKIWAALDDNDNNTPFYTTHSGDNKKYFYTFVGQFWDQKLPLYCYYTLEGTGKWYRFTDATKDYTWAAYKCVIMSTVEDDSDTHDGSGKYRDDSQSNYPSIESGSTDKLNGNLKIGFQNGIDDYNFENSARECIFLFNDDIITVEDGSETTAIEVLDGERVAPLKGKVYNMSGQHVGDSVEGLPKGLYIINGKKYVVK